MRSDDVRVAIFTSVSHGNADIAALTLPNKTEYALRHGYSLIADNMPYEEAVASTYLIATYLEEFDMVWALDADAVITNQTVRINELECLGEHVTVCEEGIVEWNLVNCGSVVWRQTAACKGLAVWFSENTDKWSALPCGWQTILPIMQSADDPGLVKVVEKRAFNSCVWNRPGNAKDEIGGHWEPGDFVYHPCGVYPLDERRRWIESALTKVVR